MRHVTVVRAGGIALIVGAVSFVAVFAYLAASFGYPEVLEGLAADVLPNLLATGGTGRAVWALYGFLPLLLIPAGAGAHRALRHTGEGAAGLAVLFILISAMAMMLGLLRWPSVHWELARAFTSADETQRAVISSLFLGLNSYLGNFVGEFLGELCYSIFFLLTGRSMASRGSGFPRWMAYLGMLTGAAGLIEMFRNVFDAVDGVAVVNNYLLPLWMVVFGIGLLKWEKPGQAILAVPTHAGAT